MKELETEVVKDVTTKKKYVKPDFEAINLENTPKLLVGSDPTSSTGSGSSQGFGQEDNGSGLFGGN